MSNKNPSLKRVDCPDFRDKTGDVKQNKKADEKEEGGLDAKSVVDLLSKVIDKK